MLTTAGEAALITGASDGNTTLAAIAAARWSVKIDAMSAMKGVLTGAGVFMHISMTVNNI
jgi:hypothetical protein